MIVDEKDLPCTLRKQAVEPEAGWSLRKISSQQGAWKGTSPSSSGLYSIAMLVLVLVLCLCLFLCVCVCRSETRLLNKQSKYQPANQPSAAGRTRRLSAYYITQTNAKAEAKSPWVRVSSKRLKVIVKLMSGSADPGWNRTESSSSQTVRACIGTFLNGPSLKSFLLDEV